MFIPKSNHLRKPSQSMSKRNPHINELTQFFYKHSNYPIKSTNQVIHQNKENHFSESPMDTSETKIQ